MWPALCSTPRTRCTATWTPWPTLMASNQAIRRRLTRRWKECAGAWPACKRKPDGTSLAAQGCVAGQLCSAHSAPPVKVAQPTPALPAHTRKRWAASHDLPREVMPPSPRRGSNAVWRAQLTCDSARHTMPVGLCGGRDISLGLLLRGLVHSAAALHCACSSRVTFTRCIARAARPTQCA